jgi:hypothetical protein
VRRSALVIPLYVVVLSILGSPVAKAECVIITGKQVMEGSRYELVFSGRVTATTRTAEIGYRATFEVDRVWKGAVSEHTDVYVWELAPERPRFEAGHRYFVLAERMVNPRARAGVGLGPNDGPAITPMQCSDAFQGTPDDLKDLGPSRAPTPGNNSVNPVLQDPTRPVRLPPSLPLAAIQIRLLRSGGGGCPGRCVHYRVTIQGDGTVRCEDLAAPPVPARERTIPAPDVVTLTNEFLAARFFEAPDRYAGRSFYQLQGTQLRLLETFGADFPKWDLSLRLGDLEKSVHLYLDYPENLGHLRDRVDQIGGPQSWTNK